MNDKVGERVKGMRGSYVGTTSNLKFVRCGPCLDRFESIEHTEASENPREEGHTIYFDG